MTDNSLAAYLAWLKIEDCSCPYEWGSYGRLYGTSMGKGWLRKTTDPQCQYHGEPTINEYADGDDETRMGS